MSSWRRIEPNIPANVERVILCGTMHSPVDRHAPAVKLNGTLKVLEIHYFECGLGALTRLVDVSSVTSVLRVTHVGVSDEDFKCMPSSLTHLIVCMTGLYVVPLRLGEMFPLLEELSLESNRIKTLEGVVLPPGLKRLSLKGNRGLSLKGIALPDTLVSLDIDDCAPLRAFSEMKLPVGLKELKMRRCRVGWVGMKWKLPPDLKICYVGQNYKLDGRQFKRSTRAINRHNMDMCYNHQDAITLFLHNRVLPIELLRHIFEYLE